MTQEEVQKEWEQFVRVLGQKVYHALVPFSEVVALMQRGMHLNQENYRLQMQAKEGVGEPVKPSTPDGDACQKSPVELVK